MCAPVGFLDQKNYCTHDIFLEIRTAHFDIPTTHFVLQNTLFWTVVVCVSVCRFRMISQKPMS